MDFQLQMISDPGFLTVGIRTSIASCDTVEASSTHTMSAPSSERMLSMLRSSPMNRNSEPVPVCRIVRSVIHNSPSKPRSLMRFSISDFELSLMLLWNCLAQTITFRDSAPRRPHHEIGGDAPRFGPASSAVQAFMAAGAK